jgi:hypothetical protein
MIDKPNDLLKPVAWPKAQFIPATGAMGDYAAAYIVSARELARNREIGGIDALPIVFLYRHALELLIKSILRQATPDGVCPQCVLKRSHSLKKQMPDLTKIGSLYGRKLSDRLTELITRWHKHDDNGMRARYPVTQEGKSDVLQSSDRFDLKAFVGDCEAAISELQELLTAVEECRYSETLQAAGISN